MTPNKVVISLLGCGWLGFPLAKDLISSGFCVRASTTSPSKLEVFQKEGIDPYLVQFSRAVQIPDLKKFFKAETLIITIPPGRRDPRGYENYHRMVDFVINELPFSTISKVILLSSSSVYGETNAEVDEFSGIFPDTESGKLLAETEERLVKANVKVICLRLAGLIGPERMPGKFFAGKTMVPNGLAPVNLVHRRDAIGIIHRLIQHEHAFGIFNGCAPIHPTREEFYTLAARLEGLEEPSFLPEKTSWKVISSARVKLELDYEFEYPSPMDWLRSL